MTDSLYRTLGVSGRASNETIRKAYRRLSKLAHPDMPGGSAERFAQVKLAHDVLTDHEARAHYDATGQVREKAIDQGSGPIFALIAGVLDHIVQQCIEQNADIVFENVADLMQQIIRKRIVQIDAGIEKAKKKEQQYARIMGRFRDKSGEISAIETVMAGRLQGLRDEVRTHEIQKGIAEQALTIVEAHEFRAEVKVVMVPWAGGASTASTSTTRYW